ncbi:MAG: hypothetical protein ACRESP_01335 [Pseudomonas sp.]|uniref:Uncharacterized protein n=1 Tax=Pseudomonas alkylphenolica TaxID=237609 RepID=A0A443ZG77_9PSED|nr:hypothetical protein [Pseudomonas alkylphenolica]MBH3428734.1 hypothetical protein [Pseudomonas alkylphenolica]RWU17829.1 hypothetical protein DM813_24385 [Pseudomonas alkylphenolica]
MKAWVITFVDQKGECTSLPYSGDQMPSIEEAARRIRAHLYPVMDELDLTDYQDRASMPTAKWLKEQSGVEITAITEAP